MSGKKIVRHCSPTLAGLKTGNIFNCDCSDKARLYREIHLWNKEFNCKGIYLHLLRIRGDKAMIYVYRQKHLVRDLENPKVRSFLSQYGYNQFTIEACLLVLSNRLTVMDDFPHEIGVFLGYPLEDIIAFIDNKGQNYKLVGYWKVYTNESEAQEIFTKYKRCTENFCQRVAAGLDITRLAIVV